MSLMSVVFRILNKAGTDFIEPRSETGHGSAANKPTHTRAVLNEAQFRELKSNLSTIENILLEVTTPLDTQPVSADTLPLPTGAATEAKQLPDNHQVQVSNFPATQAVSGVVTANQGASPYAVTQSGSWTVAVNNFPATQAVSGTVALDSATLAALESVSVQNTVTVQATALDIRNLSSASDFVSVGNFPATQPVSGTVTANLGTLNGVATEAKQLPDNHQVTVSNFPATQPVSGTVTANLGTLNGAATAANQATGNASLSSVDGKLPDLSGTWGYDSDVSGSVTIGVGKRVLQITAVAGGNGATLTINGGATVTIPALTSITIEPRGNLTAPSLVFTDTSGYFVEHVS